MARSRITLRRGLAELGAVWVAVAGLYALAGAISPPMLQVGQMLNILQVASFLGVIALGQFVVVLTGGIDLSQAATVTLTNIAATSVMLGQDAMILPAVALCLALALLAGAANGVMVAVLGITPLVATLGMNALLFGAALVYTGGAPRGAGAPALDVVGNGMVLGLPVATLVWFALALALWALMRGTVLGRWLYATGANPRAAGMMGVPVERVTIAAYLLSAVLACCGGLLLTAYVGNPSLGIGNPYLFTAVAAVVVGGAALTGGVGSVPATVGGAVFITVLGSFTNIIRVSTGAQFVIQGTLILISVYAYRQVARRRR
jgi:ribose/xylose/arabinose/galactoside ABC-type transport system permease subunit